MNKLNRLTALLMALMMIFTTFASAESVYQPGSMTQDDWDALIKQTQDELYHTDPVDERSGYPVDIPEQELLSGTPGGEQYLGAANTARFTEGSTDIEATLQRTGTLTITGVAAGKWQINVGGVWANVQGYGNAQSINLTESMLKGNHQVRQVVGDAVYTATITVVDAPEVQTLSLAVKADAEPAPTATPLPQEVQDQINNGTAMTADEVNDTFTITINYYFAEDVTFSSDGSTITGYTSGTTAASDPWTATIEAGKTLNLAVKNPTVTGYEAALQQEGCFVADQESVHISLSEADTKDGGSAVLNVQYVPAQVGYRVEHWFQNAQNDEYQMLETEEHTGARTDFYIPQGLGLTEDEIVLLTSKRPGFGVEKVEGENFAYYQLMYNRGTQVAADGSTVIEIYYDREYYLMTFDLGGGYGVDPIYAKHGSRIDVADLVPTRPGYTFLGWAAEGDATNTLVTISNTMPYQNVEFVAVWEMTEKATVTVVFWGENANDEEYSYDHTGTVQVEPGTEFTFTNQTQFLICDEEEHTHSDSCRELTCTRAEHTHSEACCTRSTDHTHTKSCYGISDNAVAQNPNNAPDDAVDGQIYTTGYLFNRQRYIFIDGSWYSYSGNASSGTIIDPSCGLDHVHGDGNCTCNQTAHTHSDACYNYLCGKTEHQHSSSCYQNGSGMNTNLWTFVRSETVTVAPDGSSIINVYYDRLPFVLRFYSGNTQVYTIEEKWGADISSHWPIKGTNGTTYDQGQSWEVDSDDSGTFVEGNLITFLEIMPEGDMRLSVNNSSSNTFYMHYLVEVLPGKTGTEYQGKLFEESFSVTAKYGNVTKAEDFFDLEGFAQFSSNPAFSSSNTISYGSTTRGNVYFYYERLKYVLSFYNHNEELVAESQQAYYESPLKNYNFTPNYPDNLEPGAYAFAGWYTDQYFNNAVNWDTATMPASDMMLYAKWEKVSHPVNFYMDEQTMSEGGPTLFEEPGMNDPDVYKEIWVLHGEMIPAEVADAIEYGPINGDYIFVEWFYRDESGVEHAFLPGQMAVNRPLNLYAKWSSKSPVEYTVRFVIDNGDGTYTDIADQITGSAVAGKTFTYDAKTGDQLKDGYQDHYYPDAGSKSIVLKLPESSEAENPNVLLFVYSKLAAVPYTVEYRYAGSNELIPLELLEITDIPDDIAEANPWTDSDNTQAIVTVRYAKVEGYMPDKAQQRLVLSSESAKNVITFLYTKDDVHAPVQIIHYTRNLDGGWDEELNLSYTDIKRGAEIEAILQDYPGFRFDASQTKLNGNVDQSLQPTTNEATKQQVILIQNSADATGVVLELFYERIEYPYEFRFLEQRKNTVLEIPVTDKEKYQETVTREAKPIDGYTLVSRSPQAIQIAIEEQQKDEEGNPVVDANGNPVYVCANNVQNFYYDENEVTIQYVVEGPASNCGAVNGMLQASEQVSVYTGTAEGAIATVNAPTFKFLGWYTKSESNGVVTWVSVDAEWLSNDGMTIKPEKTGTGKKYTDGAMVDTPMYEAQIYYARYEYNLTNLTITKAGSNETLDPNQSFIFTVSGGDLTAPLTVVIVNNGSVTISGLTVGVEYTVTEATGWSWRYTPDAAAKKITLQPSSNTLTFTNTRDGIYWLDGNATSGPNDFN